MTQTPSIESLALRVLELDGRKRDDSAAFMEYEDVTFSQAPALARYALAAGEREAHLRAEIDELDRDLHHVVPEREDLRRREAAKDAEIERLRGLLREARGATQGLIDYLTEDDEEDDIERATALLARIDAALPARDA